MAQLFNSIRNEGKSLQSGRHLQCVLALMLNKQGIDTQSTAIPIKQMVWNMHNNTNSTDISQFSTHLGWWPLCKYLPKWMLMTHWVRSSSA